MGCVLGVGWWVGGGGMNPGKYDQKPQNGGLVREIPENFRENLVKYDSLAMNGKVVYIHPASCL